MLVEEVETEWLEFLLMGLEVNGEKDMMKRLNMCTMKNSDTGELMWQPATDEYNINPFGRLIDKPARMVHGKIVEDTVFFHGFFINLRCTTDFYNRYKDSLDFYITEDEHIRRDHQPKWFV